VSSQSFANLEFRIYLVPPHITLNSIEHDLADYQATNTVNTLAHYIAMRD
jgi:hypothetical protein